jgi:ketol-acid reductoisomerase
MSGVSLYGPEDADAAALAGRRVGVIGYGSQGHAHALNLRDSGVAVHIGLPSESHSTGRAQEAGFDVMPVQRAVRAADVIALLVPDMAQPGVYREAIAPNLRPGVALLFAHGFNVHYREIEPPADVDVVLVAPKSPGQMVRSEYVAGRGVPALFAVYQDATRRAAALALAYAHALGATRAGVLETTFAHETETDLFGEQAVLCGGLTALVTAGFETLVAAGYPAELAYFECLHEMKLIVDLVYAGGLEGMRRRVSDTAEYGDYVSGAKVVGEPSRAAMREILADVRNGCFARRWIAEAAQGGQNFERMRREGRDHAIEHVGRRLRQRMAWLQVQEA